MTGRDEAAVATARSQPGTLARIYSGVRSTGLISRFFFVFLLGAGVLAVLAPVLPMKSPVAQDLTSTLQGLSTQHLLGTDQLGRDLLSRLIWGMRTTLLAGLVATLVAATIGVPLGLLSAYRRGRIDHGLNQLSDVLLTLPALILLLAARSALRSGIMLSMLILGVLNSAQVFRVVRAAALAVSRMPFVTAGRLSGCSQSRLLLRYLLPNIRQQIVVQLSFLFGFSLLVEAGLSFLGVGVQVPQSSLGSLILDGSNVMGRDFRIVAAAGLLLTALILACNVLGDAYGGEGSLDE